jgi:hypothetical protein
MLMRSGRTIFNYPNDTAQLLLSRHRTPVSPVPLGADFPLLGYSNLRGVLGAGFGNSYARGIRGDALQS